MLARPDFDVWESVGLADQPLATSTAVTRDLRDALGQLDALIGEG